MLNTDIKISVITVVYNGEAVLEGTIQSVLNQTYPNIEYIIVDGASKDRTVGIIKKYEDRISRWISEADKGLYDAMNKGLAMATGDFVWFMNAGDHIYALDTVEKLMESYEEQTDVLYGEVMVVNPDRSEIGLRSKVTTRKLPKNLHWKSLRLGMTVSHQGFLPRRSICPNYIPNNLCADIDWVIRILKKSRKNSYSPIVLASFETGGVSQKRHRESLQNRYEVLKKHYGFLPNLLNHGLIVLRSTFFKVFLKKP